MNKEYNPYKPPEVIDAKNKPKKSNDLPVVHRGICLGILVLILGGNYFVTVQPSTG